MFLQGNILKSKSRSIDYPKFVMVLFDPNPSPTQFNAIVLFCKSTSDELNEDEEAGYISNSWNTDMWELSSWDEVKSAVDRFKKISDEQAKVKEVEKVTETTVNLLDAFINFLKEDYEINIPEDTIPSFLSGDH